MKKRHLAAAASLMAVLCCLHPAQAATVNVSIIDYAFVPQDITINVNDTVTWTWESDFHSSTADDGTWDSGVYNTGYVYSFQFPDTGDYPYYCVVHGFTGDVTVQQPPPPSIAITSPTNGSVFSAPAQITLTADAEDTNSGVTEVDFFENSNPIGSATVPPYSITVSNLPAGAYQFSGVATDGAGLTATNSVAVTVVTPVGIFLSAPRFTAPATFAFAFSANSGLTYVVDRATTLGKWSPISTNVASSGSVPFQDQAASGAATFYRVRLVPNP